MKNIAARRRSRLLSPQRQATAADFFLEQLAEIGRLDPLPLPDRQPGLAAAVNPRQTVRSASRESP
jgi:hypothetical protein